MKKFSKEWVEKEIKFLEKHQETVIKRLPKIEKLRSTYDRSSGLHNLSKEQVRVKFITMKKQLQSGNVGLDKSIEQIYKAFRKDVSSLSTGIKKYKSNVFENRIDVLLAHMNNISENEGVLAQEMIYLMINEGIIDEYLQSDAFFKTPDFDSEGWLEFKDEYSESIELAKMKDYIRSKLGDKTPTWVGESAFDRYISVGEIKRAYRKKARK